MGRLRRLLGLPPAYAVLAGWGVGSGLRAGELRRVHQAVILGDEGVLLTLRPDLHGWELPGGAAHPGERGPEAVRREVREETGLEVEVEAHVGDYHRTGFAAHCASVYRCRVGGGTLGTSVETQAAAWFDPTALPPTLFPWYRGPLADALAHLPEPTLTHERQGWRAILAGMAIDLAMRWKGVEGRPARGQAPDAPRSDAA